MDALGVDPVTFVRTNGGVASTNQLRSVCSEGRMSALVREGALVRPRQGWYSVLPPSDPRFRAVAIGGRLTGVSALHEMGAWMLRPPAVLHVSVPRNAARLRTFDATGFTIHWEPDRENPHSPALCGLRQALTRAALDEDLEVSVPCFDWAFATGRLDRFDFEQVIAKLPRSARVIRDWVDPRSQSVLESVARVRLLRKGWAVRSQVLLPDLRSIDLVVEDHVGLELDGRKYHESRFEADRSKDLAIAIDGRHAIRVSARQVYVGWDEVEAAVEAALAARGRATSGIPPAKPFGRKVAALESRRFA